MPKLMEIVFILHTLKCPQSGARGFRARNHIAEPREKAVEATEFYWKRIKQKNPYLSSTEGRLIGYIPTFA